MKCDKIIKLNVVINNNVVALTTGDIEIFYEIKHFDRELKTFISEVENDKINSKNVLNKIRKTFRRINENIDMVEFDKESLLYNINVDTDRLDIIFNISNQILLTKIDNNNIIIKPNSNKVINNILPF